MPIFWLKTRFLQNFHFGKINGTPSPHQKIKINYFCQFYHFSKLKIPQLSQVFAIGCFKSCNLILIFWLENSVFSFCYFIGRSLHNFEKGLKLAIFTKISLCHTQPSVSLWWRTQGPCKMYIFSTLNVISGLFYRWKMEIAKTGFLRF